MTSDRLKKGISVYILPILFCGLLIVLALLRNDTKEPAAVRELQASEPLTLTDLAVENYLYADGFSLDRGMLLDASGKEAGTLTVTKDESGEIGASLNQIHMREADGNRGYWYTASFGLGLYVD